MRLSRILVPTLAVLALGGTAACDKTADTDKPDDAGVAHGAADKGRGDAVPDASPSTPDLDYVSTSKTSKFDVTKSDGTTYTVTVATGKLRRATEWLATGDSSMNYDGAMESIGKVDVLGQGCGSQTGVDLTESNDAVVPIKLDIKDTTPGGFKSDPEIVTDVYVGDDALDVRHGVVIQQEVHFNNGYDCFVADGVDLQSSLVATRTSTGDIVPGFLILKDYYADNNRTKFKDVKLVFSTLDGGPATFKGETGLFQQERKLDLAVNDGSTYVAGMAIELADLTSG